MREIVSFAKIANFEELNKELIPNNSNSSTIFALFSKFKLGNLLRGCNLEKRSGVSSKVIFFLLTYFRLCEKNIHSALNQRFNCSCQIYDNTFYRFLSRPTTNWRKMLGNVSFRLYNLINSETEHISGRPSCFVIDDSTLKKTGSLIERVSRVYDHVSGRYILGFKLLTLLYTDSTTNNVVDFSIHRERGKDNKYGLSEKEIKGQFYKQRKKQNPDFQRQEETDLSKIDTAIMMIKRAWKMGIRPKYVLADSWFTCAKLLKAIIEMSKNKLHFLGLSKMNNTKYNFKGETRTAKCLVAMNKCKAKTCRKYKCQYIKLHCTLSDIPITVFLIHYGRKDNWNILITTDTTIDFVKAFETYQLRWNIEVMFKECKTHLKLGQFMGRNLDGHIADCTLCFVIYNILSYAKRINSYETFGELFRSQQEELLQLTIWNRVLSWLRKLFVLIAQTINISVNEIMSLVINKTKEMKQLEEMLTYLLPVRSENVYI